MREAGELCDDGNIFNGDGCNLSCQIENGWQLVTGVTNPDQLRDICGDGKVVSTPFPGYCDSPNQPWACNIATCQTLSGYFCSQGTPTSPDQCFHMKLQRCLDFASSFANTCDISQVYDTVVPA